MATANLSSNRYENVQLITSLVIDEKNNAETGADDQTPSSGLFVVPSTVAGRTADVTGFALTSENEYGKLEFTDPNAFGASILLGDLGDVVFATPPATGNYLEFTGPNWVNGSVTLNELDDVIIAAAATNDILTFDGTDWRNGSDVVLSSTVTEDLEMGADATSLVGFYGAPSVARAAPITASTNFLTVGSGIGNGTATYEGYSVSGLVLILQDLGLLS